MKISKKIYIDKDVPRHRWIIWKLRRSKQIENIYCIVYTHKGSLEIVSSNRLKDGYKESVLIGIATTRQGAMELLAHIFDQVYVPNPSSQKMKDYFTIDNSK